MPSSSPTSAASDRREWLRIDDRLPLEYRRAGDPSAVDPISAEGEAFAALQEFLTRPAQDLLATTRPNDPQALLVPWILKMDWTLGIVLTTLARMAPGGLAVPRMTDVNISATGVSFTATRSFAVGELLEIRMILPPFMPIHTLAEVTRVAPLPDAPAGTCVLAVHFTEIRADDQDYLIRHILQLQAERLRTRHREGAA